MTFRRPGGRAGALVLLAAALAAAAGGCRPGATLGGGPIVVARPDHMVVQVAPVAANWDDRPGPDGIEAVVSFFQTGRDRPVGAAGTIRFDLYEGVVGARDLPEARPMQTRRFSGAELDTHLARSAFGWGYAFQIGWGERPPAAGSITLHAVYLAPDGARLTHQPVVVTMTAK